MNKPRAEHRSMSPGLAGEQGRFARVTSDDFDEFVVQDARVFKAGNSLAIRIPSTIARRISLDDGAAVEIAADRETMYVRKAPSRTLSDLINRITPQNVHEPMFDEPTGAERW